MRKEKNLYCSFIAKSFHSGMKTIKDIYSFSVEFLCYLLYKKLLLGKNFSLLPVIKLIDNNITFDKESIDKEWSC